MASLRDIQIQVVSCHLCPRLVHWREQVARVKVKRFANEAYWGKPIPSFGDPKARLLLVGLAPAAHGGNRTGRMFTGDESGNWLYRALHKAGFAGQATSVRRNDGLKLTDCYVTATCRCAPPQNKLLPKEIANCKPYLLQEIDLLKNIRVVVGLGKIGFDVALNAYKEAGKIEFKTKPAFAHCATHAFGHFTFIASYHPSQQNTFTGKLTEPMFDKVFNTANKILARP